MNGDRLYSFYEHIIEEVISESKKIFLEALVDVHVLHELKETWRSKILSFKASAQKSGRKKTPAKPMRLHPLKPALPLYEVSQVSTIPMYLQPMFPMTLITFDSPKVINSTSSVFTLNVQPKTVQQDQLIQVWNGQLLTVTKLSDKSSNSIVKLLPTQNLLPVTQQLDGIHPEIFDDSHEESDTDSADLDDKSKDEDVKLESDTEIKEEDPLNSDDDDDESDIDAFDCDNLIVCQYEKVFRNKNRWRMVLKDGIITIDGKDYVFQKAVGEADW